MNYTIDDCYRAIEARVENAPTTEYKELSKQLRALEELQSIEPKYEVSDLKGKINARLRSLEKTLTDAFLVTMSSLKVTVRKREILNRTCSLSGKLKDLKPQDQKVALVAISTLVFLNNLNLSRNALVEIPEHLGNLFGLSYLNLSYNPIEKLPASMPRLKALTRLDVSHSKIEVVPSLPSLRVLVLTNSSANVPQGLPESCIVYN